MASVAGDLTDHAEVNEPETDRADEVMFGRVIEGVFGRDRIGSCTGSGVFGDDVAQGFIGGYVEAAVATHGAARRIRRRRCRPECGQQSVVRYYRTIVVRYFRTSGEALSHL